MEETYYQGNGFYNYIKSHNKKGFFFLTKNRWLMVYGNQQREAKLIIYLASLTNDEYLNNEISENDLKDLDVVKLLSLQTGVPYLYVGFEEKNDELQEVKVYENNNLIYLNLLELRNKYVNYGLPISSSSSRKEINSKYSNVYQKWQLQQGNGLVASDIDLLLVNKKIECAFELKRSKISITRWEPYKEDFHNFELLSNLFIKGNIPFYIVYNHRQENPFRDCIEDLKLFSVDKRREHLCEFVEHLIIEKFFNKFKLEE